MTPAQAAGLKVGNKYVYKGDEEDDGEAGYGAGMICEFLEDDGSDLPKFSCDKSYDRDGWTYFGVNDLKEISYGNTELKIKVKDGVTTIKATGKLTSAEILEIITAINGKGE